MLIVGGSLLASAVVPIGSYYIQAGLNPTPKLIDPSDVSGVPGLFVVSALGITTVDYTQASTWFVTDSPTDPSPAPSRVKYYTLSVPRIKLTDVTVEINGVDLKKNAIQYPGTAIPGSFGNAVVFGHSALPQFYQSGNPLTIFNPLLRMKLGDEIIVNYDGVTYRYLTREIKEVKPTDIEVLAQRYDRHEITLVTCVPLGTYWHRLIVRADLAN